MRHVLLPLRFLSSASGWALSLLLAGVGPAGAAAREMPAPEAAQELRLPLPPDADLAPLENHDVLVRGPLVLLQAELRGNRPRLLVADGRQQAPTQAQAPGSAAEALERSNAARRLVVELAALPAPRGASCRRVGWRAGDTTGDLRGVLARSRGAAGQPAWVLRPLAEPRFTRPVPRPPQPPRVGTGLRIGGMNLDNFFSTLADGRHGCGPRARPSDCRGARSPAEFERQRDRLATALAGLDADVLALMEIEHDDGRTLQVLLDALARREGPGAWARVPEPVGGAGRDPIRVALLYRPAHVEALGPPASDVDPVHARAPLAQRFVPRGGGAPFDVVAVHFKSRRCDGASGPELDQHDGQGCWSALRQRQARALRMFIARRRLQEPGADAVVVGDFNASPGEDPVTEFTSHGFVDAFALHDPAAYTYVHAGAAGRLDQLLVGAGLAARVTGAGAWHIDADEPSCPPAPAEPMPDDPAPGPWRASDHDPVLLGLRARGRRRGRSGRQCAPCKCGPISRSRHWWRSRPSCSRVSPGG